MGGAQPKGEWLGDRPGIWLHYFRRLPSAAQHTFVDIGAGDGTFMSNTAFLEGAHCWRGLAVEPTKNEYAKLEINRPGSSTVRFIA